MAKESENNTQKQTADANILNNLAEYTVNIDDLFLQGEVDDEATGAMRTAKIFSLSLNYSVGAFPFAEMTIGPWVASKQLDDMGNSIQTAEITERDLQARQTGPVTIIMRLSNGSAKDFLDIRLFSGYVASDTIEVVTSATKLAKRRTIKVVCETELLQTTALGSLRQWHENTGVEFEYVDLNVLAANVRDSIGSMANSEKIFVDNVSYYLALAFDHFLKQTGVQNTGDNADNGGSQTDNSNASGGAFESDSSSGGDSGGATETQRTFENSVEHCSGSLTLTVPPACGMLPPMLSKQIASLLGADTPASAFARMLRTFYLGWLPQTVAPMSGNMTTKMITRPICGWDSRVTFQIKDSDILSITTVSNFALSTTIDYYVVTLGPQTAPHYAVYSTTQAKSAKDAGKAEVSLLTYQQLTTELEKRSKNRIAYTVHPIQMPGWIELLQAKSEDSPGQSNATPPSTPENSGDTELEAAWKKWAGYVSMLSFLINSRDTSEVRISVPFMSWLRMLPHLGNVVNIENSELYGGLSSLVLRIDVEDDSILTHCSVAVSSVHTKEEHEVFATVNPMYNAFMNGGTETMCPGQYAAVQVADTINRWIGMAPEQQAEQYGSYKTYDMDDLQDDDFGDPDDAAMSVG